MGKKDRRAVFGCKDDRSEYVIFGINTTSDISKLSQITYNNFEISLVLFIIMPNITSNHAITYTKTIFLILS